MRYARLFIAAGFILNVSSTAQAQLTWSTEQQGAWTAEQQEVWEFEMRCFQVRLDKDWEGRKGCFHEDYEGWFSPDPAPLPYNESIDQYYFEKAELIGFTVKPHSIRIFGSVAIINLSFNVAFVGPDGNDSIEWRHWTDIALKENGRWYWIADHGHPGTSD